MITIHRYKNRKFYNTDDQMHTNLTKIANMIRMGVEVQVIDKPTGRDITDRIMTKILVIEATGGMPIDILMKKVRNPIYPYYDSPE